MKPEIRKDVDLAPLTTFGVPARARMFAEYSSVKELEALSRMPEFTDHEVLHIGGGSNLLFVRDFHGLALHSLIKGIKIYRKNEEEVYVIAGAGEKWDHLVDFCLDNNLGGLECMAGIPGEVGASAVQNVGAYGAEAKDVIFSVECFDVQTRTTVTFRNSQCRFAYRDSMFKHEGKGRYIVVRVCYRLNPSIVAKCLEYGPLHTMAKELGRTPTIREVATEVRRLRDSKLPDPRLVGSAGSFFKNPVISRYAFVEEIQPRNPEMPFYDVDADNVKLPAGWLIEHAGLKGVKVGGAEVWPKQCLVIANTGNATARDVTALARKIVARVRRKFGVVLKPEVNYIDDGIEVTILGSGVSKGVPEVGCDCDVCRSEDPHDKRLRCSALIRTRGLNLLLDVSPDFRYQALSHDIDSVDAALITHSHYDHVGGIDDLRPLCWDKDMPLYVREDVDRDLRRRLDYCFRKHPYPGVPTFEMNIVSNEPFFVNGLKVIPVEVMHGKLPIYGYRIGDFAYITDAKTIAPEEKEKLTGLKVLVVNALRERPHFAHFNLQEALDLIEELKPEKAYLTHMCHDMGCHEEVNKRLPSNVALAYDGLTFTVE